MRVVLWLPMRMNWKTVSLLEKLQSSSADCAGPLQPKELGTALEAMKPDPPAKNRQ